jgi:hypothetical protein
MTKRPATVVDKSDTSWHVDKKVPISLIVTLVLVFGGQTVTALWWASKVDARIERLEDTAKLSTPQTLAQGDRLTRVEVKLESVLDSVTEIKTLLRSAKR